MVISTIPVRERQSVKFSTQESHRVNGLYEIVNCSVGKGHTKFTITREFLEKTGAKLFAVMQHVVPDEQFRFLTFERDDYAEQKLTMLLFNFVPNQVFVTVPEGYDLAKAVAEVETLNSDLLLEKVNLHYIDTADAAKNRQTQELRIIYRPMQVDASGKLVQ